MLVLVLVVLGLATSWDLLRRVIGSQSPWLALLWQVYFLGICSFAQPVIDLRMPQALQRVRCWELGGGWCRLPGFACFGKSLTRSPLRWLNMDVYLAGRRDGRRRELERLRGSAMFSEAAHFWAGVLFAPYLAWLLVAGRYGYAALFALVQLPLNVYPALHLRVLRGRLQRLQARAPAGGSRPPTHA